MSPYVIQLWFSWLIVCILPCLLVDFCKFCSSFSLNIYYFTSPPHCIWVLINPLTHHDSTGVLVQVRSRNFVCLKAATILDCFDCFVPIGHSPLSQITIQLGLPHMLLHPLVLCQFAKSLVKTICGGSCHDILDY